jgi:hypothetical protein
MNKQSSIDWLYNTIDDEIVSYLDGEKDLNELSIAMLKTKKQAKAMHKEEVLNAYEQGEEDGYWHPENGYNKKFENSKQYYNETYGGQDER